MRAWSKNSTGCWAQMRLRVRLMASRDPGRHTGGTAREVACGGGVGDSLCIQGVEISLVVAEPFQMLELGAAGHDVQGDVHHMVGLVVGEMVLEQMQVVIDVSDQSSPACQQEHGADATWAQSLDPIAQLVVDVLAAIMGRSRWGPGRFSMRRRILRLRRRSLFKTLDFTRKSPLFGLMRI